jgi:uncharacterized delta-60 repeat protein
LTVRPTAVPAGTLDLTFAPARDQNDALRTVAAAPGRGVIAGGSKSTPPYYLRRFGPDGRWDDGFRPWMPTYCCSMWNSFMTLAVAVQPDGSLVVAATHLYSRGDPQPNHLLFRLSADGCLDPMFARGSWQDAALPNIGPFVPYKSPVMALAVEADGRILVAGSYTNLNGNARTNLSRLNADGTLDPAPFALSVSGGELRAIAVVPGGKILLAGSFSAVNGIARNKLALIDPDGVLETSFDAGAGPNGPVNAIAVQTNGRVLLAGDFAEIEGQPRERLARLLSNGRLDRTFTPRAILAGSSPSMTNLNAVALDEFGQILVAGTFRMAAQGPGPAATQRQRRRGI